MKEERKQKNYHWRECAKKLLEEFYKVSDAKNALKELESLYGKSTYLGLYRQVINPLGFETFQLYVLNKLLSDVFNYDTLNFNKKWSLFAYSDLPYSSKNSDISSAVKRIFIYENEGKTKIKQINLLNRLNHFGIKDGVTIRYLKIDGKDFAEYVFNYFPQEIFSLKDISSEFREMIRTLVKYGFTPKQIFLIEKETGHQYPHNIGEMNKEDLERKLFDNDNWRPDARDYYPLFVLGHYGEYEGVMPALYLFDNFEYDVNFVNKVFGFAEYCKGAEFPIIKIQYPTKEEIGKHTNLLRKIGGNVNNIYSISVSQPLFEDIAKKVGQKIEELKKPIGDLRIGEVQEVINETFLKTLDKYLNTSA
ncbi:MAG: hypothetical protein QW197_02730 [Candidatus Aenigmatarchaeota archaeon]